MENYPALPPPSGVVPNFVDPETRAPVIIVFCALSLGLMWPILITRLYSKIWILHSFGWDDGTLLPLKECTILADEENQQVQLLPRYRSWNRPDTLNEG